MVNLKWVAIGVAALLLVAWHHYDKRDAINRVHAEYALKAYKASENSHQTTVDLLNSSLASLGKKDEEIKRISSSYDALVDSLRKRPTRDSSPASSTPSTCTGAQLYREDGTFLAGEAARAERITKERDFYYEQYERARLSLDALKRKNEGLYGEDAH